MGLCCGRPKTLADPTRQYLDSLWKIRPESTAENFKCALCTSDPNGGPSFVKASNATWAYLHWMMQSIHENPISEAMQDAMMAQMILMGKTLFCVTCGEHWVMVMQKFYKFRKQIFSTPHHAACFMFQIHNLWNHFLGRDLLAWADYCEMYHYHGDFINVLRDVTHPGYVSVQISGDDGAIIIPSLCNVRDVSCDDRHRVNLESSRTLGDDTALLCPDGHCTALRHQIARVSADGH